jgi:hypothetical protein
MILPSEANAQPSSRFRHLDALGADKASVALHLAA